MPDKQEVTRDSNGRFITSGNPNGRPPKALCISDLMREIGREDAGSGTLMEQVVIKAYELAINGNMRAIEFITERLEGKVAVTEIIDDSDLCEGFEIVEIGSVCKECGTTKPKDEN
tara:strand:+ start:194 stop:541 length:348 start_codon:yes stop_codon:yes gene_type:complete